MSKISRLASASIFLLFFSFVNGQTDEFYSVFNTRAMSAYDTKGDFVQCASGEIYAAMILSDSTQEHEGRTLLLKISQAGEIIWQKIIPGLRGDVGLTTDNEHNLILASMDTTLHATVCKISPMGDLIWSKSNNTILSYSMSVIATATDYYVFGSLQGIPSWEYDYFVTRFDYDGNIIWSKVYDTGKGDKMADAVLTNDNQLVFVGYFKNETDVIHFANPVKIDLDGNLIWSTKISFGTITEVKDLTQRSDGMFGITGRTEGGFWKIFYSMFDQNGVEQHRAIYSITTFQEGYSIHGLDEGGFMLCIEPETFFDNYFWQTAMMKINDYGVPQNTIVYDISAKGSFPFGSKQLSDGFLLMGIKTDSSNLWLMKTDKDGYVYCNEQVVDMNHEQATTYTSNQTIFEIDIFPFVESYVELFDLSTTHDVICTHSSPSDSTDIVHYLPDVPNVFSPNNDGINDIFQVNYPYSSGYLLIIMNRWGEVVFESNSPIQSWDGKHSSNLKDASEGTYFYKLTVGNLSKHGTVTLVR